MRRCAAWAFAAPVRTRSAWEHRRPLQDGRPRSRGLALPPRAARDAPAGKGLPPVLLFQATEDAATPYEGGVAMRDALPGLKLVVQSGGSFHEILFHGNACLDDTFTAYLRDGSLPKGNDRIAKTCAPEPDPDPVYVTPPPAAAAPAAGPLARTDPETVRGLLR
ncbi:alpha/beta hydrolase [Kitasatospora sp. NBC_01246]|uniref:alpha/beta hydrolase n=1 Tax=Kitasatospora sp. NBC_01246 TaxID=2903570 RepID=UPI002E358B93|nr:alpha/beta hydrolase [Kitasatospora sp. NBC_01246]